MLTGRTLRPVESDRPERRKKGGRTVLSSPSFRLLTEPRLSSHLSQYPRSHTQRKDMWTSTTLESAFSLPTSLFSYSLLPSTQTTDSARFTPRKLPHLREFPIKSILVTRPFPSPCKPLPPKSAGTLLSHGKLRPLLSSQSTQPSLPAQICISNSSHSAL